VSARRPRAARALTGRGCDAARTGGRRAERVQQELQVLAVRPVQGDGIHPAGRGDAAQGAPPGPTLSTNSMLWQPCLCVGLMLLIKIGTHPWLAKLEHVHFISDAHKQGCPGSGLTSRGGMHVQR